MIDQVMVRFGDLYCRREIEMVELQIYDNSKLPNSIKDYYFLILIECIEQFFKKNKGLLMFNTIIVQFNDKNIYTSIAFKDNFFDIGHVDLNREGFSYVAEADVGESDYGKGIVVVGLGVDNILFEIIRSYGDKFKDDIKEADEISHKMIKFMLEKRTKYIKYCVGGLKHEMIHHYHTLNNEKLKKVHARNIGRLHGMRSKYEAEEIKYSNAIQYNEEKLYGDYNFFDMVISLRAGIEVFSFNCLEEGIARFFQNPVPKVLYEWKKYYSIAEKKSQEVHVKFYEIIELLKRLKRLNIAQKEDLYEKFRDFRKILKSNAYGIGLHQVHTISFTPTNIFKLNRKQFYHLYEDICKHKCHKKPVVTYGHHGIFDIKKAKRDLNAARKVANLKSHRFKR